MATITKKVGHVVGEPAGFGTPTASVDANVGTPSVTITASGPDTEKVFDFEFSNLRGAAAGFGTPTARVDDQVGTPSVTITASGPDTAKVFDFDFSNLQGAAAGFGTPTASVDSGIGTPSVTISSSGPNTEKVFNFQFKNLKGVKGDTGYYIGSITKKSGSGLPGTTDVYSIKLNDAQQTEIGTFNVYNGIDGLGSGDMKQVMYDTDNDGKVDYAENADNATNASSVPWSGITGKPIGTANGIAELDNNGTVPSSQLPSYVDDVLEYDSQSNFPVAGEGGKIYIAKNTNITYRWSGSTYVPIGSDLALGETSSTAYRGDRGKVAYEHSQDSSVHTTAQQLADLQANTISQCGNARVIIVQNVESSTWTRTNTYADFPYRASLAVNGMTVNHMPEVIFVGNEEATDKIVQYCQSYDGGIYIYASADVGVVTAQTVKGIKGD